MSLVASANLSEGNELFQKNLKYLPEFIKQQIQNADIEEIEKSIEIVYSKEGNPVCLYKQDGKVKHINSRNPWEEAQNWCNQLPLNQMGTLIVFGCGFGYPIIELCKRVHKDTLMVIFEYNLPIFIAMLHFFDLEIVFQTHSKCIFFVGSFEGFSQHFQNLISSYGLLYLTSPSILYTPGARIFKKEYQNIQTQVYERMTQKIFSYGNDHYDSLVGFHNMMQNAEMVIENPNLSSLKNKFHDVPAFIVANGPSLDSSIEELKQVKGKGLILCCESAIVPLMKNGLNPDAICVLERVPESYMYHFQDKKYPEDITLLALSVADPRTFASFAGPKIPIFRSFESTSQWINQLLGDGSGLYAGFNVSHLAYELAVYMGANPIVLVGQNFAYGADGITHSKQSKYTEEAKDYIDRIRSMPMIYVEGEDVARVPSNPLWVEFRKGLESLIEQTPHLTVINTTKGGSKIKGTIPDTLKNVIEKYCNSTMSIRLEAILTESKKNINVEDRRNKSNCLRNELTKYIEIYRALNQLNSERKNITVKLLDRSKIKIKYMEKLELHQQFELNNKHIMSFLKATIHNQFFQQVILYGYHQINELGALITPEKFSHALLIHLKLFDHLSVVCQSLIMNFQIALENLPIDESFIEFRE